MNYFNITILTIALFFSASGVFGSAAAPPSTVASSSAIDAPSSVHLNTYGLTQAQQDGIYRRNEKSYVTSQSNVQIHQARGNVLKSAKSIF